MKSDKREICFHLYISESKTFLSSATFITKLTSTLEYQTAYQNNDLEEILNYTGSSSELWNFLIIEFFDQMLFAESIEVNENYAAICTTIEL